MAHMSKSDNRNDTKQELATEQLDQVAAGKEDIVLNNIGDTAEREPASVREAASRSECSNNLKQMG